jgi:hypothetical protein
MVDADPAIHLWWSAVFDGWLDKVAERIRDFELDGEELWRSIVYLNGKDGSYGPATVPSQPVGRLAAWLIAQKGNFSAKPLTWAPGALPNCPTWQGVAGFSSSGFWAKRGAKGENMAQEAAMWQGVAGYGHVSRTGKAMGFPDRVNAAAIAEGAILTPSGTGCSKWADLNVWAPDVQPGDLVAIDPPYASTTGYGPTLTRDRVVELALQADAAGARVLVHEAEAVITPGVPARRLEATFSHLVAPEKWRAVELRKGERRNQDTWRKRGKNGAREVVTINFEPAGRLGVQEELFG